VRHGQGDGDGHGCRRSHMAKRVIVKTGQQTGRHPRESGLNLFLSPWRGCSVLRLYRRDIRRPETLVSAGLGSDRDERKGGSVEVADQTRAQAGTGTGGDTPNRCYRRLGRGRESSGPSRSPGPPPDVNPAIKSTSCPRTGQAYAKSVSNRPRKLMRFSRHRPLGTSRRCPLQQILCTAPAPICAVPKPAKAC